VDSHDAPTSGPPGDQLSGRLLVGRYRLNRPIASGGMAEVWEATDETLARRVAVKLLHPHLGRDESFVRRFRAEAVAAARLAHPSIVSVYDTFSADGMEAIVMELVLGTTMRSDLDQHGPMRLEPVLAIGTQVADALAAAHASGLVHRDVKPANILLSADGRVLVADFGIAKAAEGNDLTSAGAMVGTAKYLAPEQVEGGAIDGRADLYALGVVLYEALTGVPPFAEETDTATALARLHRYPTEPRQIRPEIPVAVEAVVMRAMSRAPADRFDTAAAMRTALMGAGADPGRAPAAAVAAAAANPPMAPAPPAAAGTPPPPRAPTAPPPIRPAQQRPAAVPAAPPAPAAAPPAEVVADPSAPSTLEAPAAPRHGRRWLLLLGVLVIAGIVAALVLGSEGTPDGGGGTGGSADAVVPISSAASFDPLGDSTEHDDQVPNAVDGKGDTAWTSENYTDPDAMAGKDGVGLVLALDGSHDLGQVDVESPEAGWSAQIYVVDGDAPADLAGWGEPLTSVQSATAGPTRFTLPDATGNHVLVWFTRTPPSGTIVVSDVTVRAA
jgi:tRNA A-37 threonylcarbamoyl transferase component Bud32